MRFLLEVPIGMEDVCEKEVKEKIKNARNFSLERGKVYFDLAFKKWKKTLNLRSIHFSNVFLDHFILKNNSLNYLISKLQKIDYSLLEQFSSYRVICKRFGIHKFKSIQVEKKLGDYIHSNYKIKTDLENFEVGLKVKIVGRHVYALLQLHNKPLNKRDYFVFNHPTQIDASLAYGMIRLANAKKGNILVDPFCGSATIPIEAALFYGKKVKIFGMDISKQFIENAWKNVRKAKVENLVELKVGDARNLENYFEKIDIIVSNPPYGIKFSEKGIKGLYAKFLESSSKVLNFGGKIIVAILRSGIFRNLVLKQRNFRILEERVVFYGGLYPNLFILERI